MKIPELYLCPIKKQRFAVFYAKYLKCIHVSINKYLFEKDSKFVAKIKNFNLLRRNNTNKFAIDNIKTAKNPYNN